MLRILIAEDEPLEQQSLKDILEWNFSCGVDIKTASNGVDASALQPFGMPTWF